MSTCRRPETAARASRPSRLAVPTSGLAASFVMEAEKSGFGAHEQRDLADLCTTQCHIPILSSLPWRRQREGRPKHFFNHILSLRKMSDVEDSGHWSSCAHLHLW